MDPDHSPYIRALARRVPPLDLRRVAERACRVRLALFGIFFSFFFNKKKGKKRSERRRASDAGEREKEKNISFSLSLAASTPPLVPTLFSLSSSSPPLSQLLPPSTATEKNPTQSPMVMFAICESGSGKSVDLANDTTLLLLEVPGPPGLRAVFLLEATPRQAFVMTLFVLGNSSSRADAVAALAGMSEACPLRIEEIVRLLLRLQRLNNHPDYESRRVIIVGANVFMLSSLSKALYLMAPKAEDLGLYPESMSKEESYRRQANWQTLGHEGAPPPLCANALGPDPRVQQGAADRLLEHLQAEAREVGRVVDEGMKAFELSSSSSSSAAPALAAAEVSAYVTEGARDLGLDRARTFLTLFVRGKNVAQRDSQGVERSAWSENEGETFEVVAKTCATIEERTPSSSSSLLSSYSPSSSSAPPHATRYFVIGNAFRMGDARFMNTSIPNYVNFGRLARERYGKAVFTIAVAANAGFITAAPTWRGAPTACLLEEPVAYQDWVGTLRLAAQFKAGSTSASGAGAAAAAPETTTPATAEEKDLLLDFSDAGVCSLFAGQPCYERAIDEVCDEEEQMAGRHRFKSDLVRHAPGGGFEARYEMFVYLDDTGGTAPLEFPLADAAIRKAYRRTEKERTGRIVRVTSARSAQRDPTKERAEKERGKEVAARVPGSW